LLDEPDATLRRTDHEVAHPGGRLRGAGPRPAQLTSDGNWLIVAVLDLADGLHGPLAAFEEQLRTHAAQRDHFFKR